MGFPGWSYLHGMLLINAKLDPENAQDFCDYVYHAVREGAGLEECMSMLGADYEKNSSLATRIGLWEVCLHFLLGTALPGLKGACRAAASRDPSYSMFPARFFVNVNDIVEEGNIGPLTHIEHMPERMQTEIGTRLFTLEEEDLQPMKKLLRRYSNNADLNFIMGRACQRMNHMDEAIKYLQRSERILGGDDPGIQAIIESCRQGYPGNPIAVYRDGMVVM